MFGTMKRLKIRDVKIYGEIVTMAMLPFRYDSDQLGFLTYKGITGMPKGDEIKWDNKYLYRCMTEHVVIEVFEESGNVHQFHIKPGNITDFATIPRFLRGSALLRVDNDDPRIIVPSVLHDLLGAYDIFEPKKGTQTRKAFNNINYFFKALCRFYGFSRYQCHMLMFGVNSHVGWKMYTNKRPFQTKVNRCDYKFMTPEEYKIENAT